jgi:hypothetical protein
MAGGMVRCVDCGEIQWNLLSSLAGKGAECRVCGAELRTERRRPGRRFNSRLSRERRDVSR